MAVIFDTTSDVHDLYTDGTLDSSSSISVADVTGFDTITLADRYDAGFTGSPVLDEVQYHGTERSADWIEHEFNQTDDNATFWGTWTWNSSGVSTIPRLTLLGVG